jgi:hypothetical protein
MAGPDSRTLGRSGEGPDRGVGRVEVERGWGRSVDVAGHRRTRRVVTTVGGRPSHLALVRPDASDQPGPVEVAAAAHRLSERMLGPVGTDPDETGDPVLVPRLRRADGTLTSRARLERELAFLLTVALDDRWDGAAERLAAHLATVLAELGVLSSEKR